MTFRDPESARRACENASPVIDGRRANCNLASLGRPRPPLPYGTLCFDPQYRLNVNIEFSSCFDLRIELFMQLPCGTRSSMTRDDGS